MTRSLYPRGRIPGIHSIWGWVGSRDGLYSVAKRKSPCQESNTGRPARSLATTLTELLRRPGAL